MPFCCKNYLFHGLCLMQFSSRRPKAYLQASNHLVKGSSLLRCPSLVYHSVTMSPFWSHALPSSSFCPILLSQNLMWQFYTYYLFTKHNFFNGHPEIFFSVRLWISSSACQQRPLLNTIFKNKQNTRLLLDYK